MNNITNILKEKWEIVPCEFWIPLAGVVSRNTCYFDTNSFEENLSFEKLNSIINEEFIDEVIEINELQEFKVYPILNLKKYNGLDSYYTNKNADWVIYITHEETIAFAGLELIEQIKEHWVDFEKYINPWTNDYFEKEIILKRKEIWKAISSFYLDTTLQDIDYDNISEVLRESEFSIEELMKIDLFEVFPLLQSNLNRIAGEWDNFDSDWLIQNCLKNYYKKENTLFRLTAKLKSRIYFRARSHHWEEIKGRVKTNT